MDVKDLPTLNFTKPFSSNEVKISQSSATFTKKSMIAYNEIIKSVIDNIDLITEVLLERHELERDVSRES